MQPLGKTPRGPHSTNSTGEAFSQISVNLRVSLHLDSRVPFHELTLLNILQVFMDSRICFRVAQGPRIEAKSRRARSSTHGNLEGPSGQARPTWAR